VPTANCSGGTTNGARAACKPGKAAWSCTKAAKHRGCDAASTSSGLPATMAAGSLADFTITGAATCSCASSAAAMSATCFAGVPLVAWNTALPLLSKVATSV